MEAPAAVGKSTFAAHLSASRRLPLLNLAQVRVSTGTLAGLLASEFSDPRAAGDAFHLAELPILIDALDEGLILSGDLHVEDFLRTTCELLLLDRRVTGRPKLIFLARPEAAAQRQRSTCTAWA